MIWTSCFSQAPNDFGCNGESSIDAVAEESQLCSLFVDGGRRGEITRVGGNVGGY